jgi:hypothetical protein
LPIVPTSRPGGGTVNLSGQVSRIQAMAVCIGNL